MRMSDGFCVGQTKRSAPAIAIEPSLQYAPPDDAQPERVEARLAIRPCGASVHPWRLAGGPLPCRWYHCACMVPVRAVTFAGQP